ncbi:hypothetical protein BY458DRAFT_519933 [Sporodiniella umbellata]|nr:hypothetical protein BY458DRAFT_519933 [Sporodiniella umbellata]
MTKQIFSVLLRQAAAASKEWQWRNYTIESQEDWNKAIYKKECPLVGLRFFLASDLERSNVQLVRHSKTILLGQRFAYNHNEEFVPLNYVLQDAKDYFSQCESSPENSALQEVLDLRLGCFAQDMNTLERESNELDNTEYHLTGAIMASNEHPMCCLYMRDFAESPEGLNWRIFGLEEEKRISCAQAIIDIRRTGRYAVSEFSKRYRPLYLFYCNQEILVTPVEEQSEEVQQAVPENSQISWEDYTVEQCDGDELTHEEGALCIHCGIEDIVDDVNDIFICESCESGVHQLCENPPIQNYEKEIDPWFCRACCRQKNLPIPQQLPLLKRKREEDIPFGLNKVNKS